MVRPRKPRGRRRATYPRFAVRSRLALKWYVCIFIEEAFFAQALLNFPIRTVGIYTSDRIAVRVEIDCQKKRSCVRTPLAISIVG
jgi:hypothetical protein